MSSSSSSTTIKRQDADRIAQGVALLKSSLPANCWTDDPSVMERYLVDWRGLYHGNAPLVLRPNTTEQVSTALRICNEHGIGVVPQAGNTNMTGGAIPSKSGGEVVLALDRFDKIRDLDPDGFTITVEAGCILADIQTAADRADRLFPLSLGAEGSCRIGGNLSTNAGGIQVVRYGMARDLVLGLEVVLPDGRILNALSGLRKDNTGYDLKQLFIGAEGTLGVITAATLKLYPKPRDRVTAFYAVENPTAALRLFSELRDKAADGVIAFELIHRSILDLVFKNIPRTVDPLSQAYEWYVLFEVIGASVTQGLQEGIEACTESWMEAGLVLDGTVAANEAQRTAFWRIRESMANAQKEEGVGIRHDVSVPVKSVPEFIAKAIPAMHAALDGVRPMAFGHVGDGNVHFNLLQPIGMPEADFQAQSPRLNRIVHDIVAEMGGSISAEHGIGQIRRAELFHYKPAMQIDIMRDIKRVLDPNGIMNPGKLL